MANSAVVGLLRVLLQAETAQFESEMKKAANSAKAWTRDLKSIGQQATDLGMTLTKAFTVPIVGLGVAASKMAIDFESAFANVAKTVDGVADKSGNLTVQGKALAQTFREMAKEIPKTTEELTQIAALGGQMGVPIANMAKFTENVAALGVAVDGISTEEAAAGLAQIGNIFGDKTLANVDKMSSALVHLGNSSNATEADILEFSKRLAGAGNAAGMTIPQVMALGTAMANVGLNAEAGGTAMSTMISKMSMAVSEGGEALEAFAKVARMSAEEFAETWRRSPIEAIDAVVKGLAFAKTSGQDLNLVVKEIGATNIRTADTMKRLAGAADGVSTSLTIANEGWSTGNKHLEEAEKKYATTANQLKLLWNQVKDVGITLGNALLPAIKTATSMISTMLPMVDLLAKGFAALPGPIQLIAIGVAGLVAAAGPLLVIFGQLAIAASTLTATFTTKGIVSRALATHLGVLRSAYAVLTTPITLSTTATAAGTVAMTAKSVAARALSVSLGVLRGAVNFLLGPIGLLTAAVGLATAAFVSWKQAQADARVEAETTAAKQDEIARAISRGAKATINYTEAIKFNHEWNERRLKGLKDVGNETQRTEGATKSLTDKLAELNAKTKEADRQIAQLSATAKAELVKAINAGTFSVDELRAASGLGEFALKRFEETLKQTAKATKVAAKETKALEDQLEFIRDAVEGVDDAVSRFARENELAEAAKQAKEDLEGLKIAIEEVAGRIEDAFDKKNVELPFKSGIEAARDFWDTVQAMGDEAASIGDQIADGLGQAFADVARVTDGWISSLLHGLSNVMGVLGNMATFTAGTLSQKLSGIGQGIASTIAAVQTGTTTQRTVGGAASGFATGAMIGSIIPGIGTVVGGLVGAGIGGLVGFFSGKKAGKKADKEATQQIRDMQKELVGLFGSLEDIDQIGKAIGVDLAGVWGVEGRKGLEQFADVAAEFQERIEGLSEELVGIAEHGGVASKELITFRDAMKDSAEMAAFLKDQTLQAADGVSTFLKSATVQTEAGAQALGGVIAGAFAELQRQGMSAREALAALKDPIAQLQAQLEKTGFSGGEAFGYIQHLAAIAANEISGPAMDAISGLTAALQGAHNAGFLTQEMFTGLVGEIMAQREAILGTGVAAETVNSLMQRDLQTIWQLQQDFNYQVDEATQKLLDEAEAAGTVGDKYRSAMDRAARAMERVADALERVLGKTGNLKDELDNLPRNVDIDVNVREKRTTDYVPSEDDDGTRMEPQDAYSGGGMVPQYAAAGRRIASMVNWRPIGSDTVPAMLTPGEVVLNAAQQRNLADTLTSGVRALELATSGGVIRGDMYVTLDMRGARVDSPERAREIGESFAAALAQHPTFQRTLEREMKVNTYGLGSAIRQTVKV